MTLRHPFLSVLSYICYILCWWQNGEFSKSYCMFSHSNGIRRGHSARTDLFQTGFKFIHFHSHLQYCIALHMNFNIISFYLFVLIAAEHMKIPYPGTLHSKVRTLQNIKKPNKSCLSRDSVTVESKTKEQKQAQGRWSSASSDRQEATDKSEWLGGRSTQLQIQRFLQQSADKDTASGEGKLRAWTLQQTCICCHVRFCHVASQNLDFWGMLNNKQHWTPIYSTDL